MTKQQKIFNAVVIAMFFIMVAISIASINERNDLIIENEQLETELNASKQKWADFNKSYMPETALPRLHEVEKVGRA